uniref:Small ribosomal subunit protein uS2c n=1 Tax=Tydemania expeditionis TaxID=325645 RepID=A0A0D6E1N2_TYDEX|nr:30S ribosomal protein S2 [Tydemania expeditionis]CEO91139.1 30S ribosomal protein S2 [Tydemania expeditionis]
MVAMTVQEIVQQMVSAGVHFGHRRHQRNPKMIPYIYTEKDDLQIIDLLQTYWYLQLASSFLFEACRQGKRVLFIGTQKHIAKCIEQTANDCDSWYINKRWLGGLFTNWKTLKPLISKMGQKENQVLIQTKKEKAKNARQKKRLLKYLGGVETMFDLPNIVIIVGQQKEMNAVRECQKLKIPSLTILDTNCDPDLTDLFIPGNDDSAKSVHYILNKLALAIRKGQKESMLLKK